MLEPGAPRNLVEVLKLSLAGRLEDLNEILHLNVNANSLATDPQCTVSIAVWSSWSAGRRDTHWVRAGKTKSPDRQEERVTFL